MLVGDSIKGCSFGSAASGRSIHTARCAAGADGTPPCPITTPAGDQSSTTAVTSNFFTTVSFCVPVALFRKNVEGVAVEYTTWDPSDDHTGAHSSAESKVNRVV